MHSIQAELPTTLVPFGELAASACPAMLALHSRTWARPHAHPAHQEHVLPLGAAAVHAEPAEERSSNSHPSFPSALYGDQ